MGIVPNSGANFGGGGLGVPSAAGLVTAGLVAEYRFDEGTGQQLTDYFGGYHGQLGSTSGADANDPTWVASPASLGFDGSNDYIDLTAAGGAAGANATIIIAAEIDNALNPQYFFDIAGNALGASVISAGTIRIYRNSAAVGTSISTLSDGPTLVAFRFREDNESQSTFDIATSNGASMEDFYTVTGIPPATPDYFRLSKASVAFNDKIYYLILYSRWLTDDELQQNYEYLQGVMAARSVTI